MKKLYFLMVAVLFAATTIAEPPANYYSSIDGKTGNNIKSALSGIISSHTNVGYDGLYDVYAKADMREDGKTLWDMYSDCEFTINSTSGSNATVCGCYNREHSLPKSWWGGNKAAQYSDAYHVVPTDCRVNNQRSNYAFGECEGGERLSVKARGKLGSSTFAGYNNIGKVFEPDDEYKGDFARHYFYMLTAYPNVDFSTGNGGTIFSGAGQLTAYGVALLLKWHRLDPVSTKELNRNDAVSSFQKNRNPFIDYPCLVEYIWGDKKNDALDLSNIVCAYSADYASSDLTGCYSKPTSPTILEPSNGKTVEIEASLNQTESKSLSVIAALLNSPVTLQLSGANASYFSLSTQTIPADVANQGTDITINYTPAALGTHSATLTLSSNGAKDVTVALTGTCLANLVSPSADIIVTNNNVGYEMPFSIHIKGTNLSSDIQLGINSNMISLSRETVTASEANTGIDITGYYTPTAVGEHNADLSITSPDFTTRKITIRASCVFEVLPTTNITFTSAQLNWTNAGVTDYIVNVYQKRIYGTEEEVILSDNCADTKGTKGDGYQQVENDALRLGSSSKTGSLSFSGLDLSKGGKIEYEAKYYSNDNSLLEVRLGSNVIAKQQLTDEFVVYSIDVEPNEANKDVTLTFSTLEKSKRAYLKTVYVFIGGETIANVSIEGYPMHVGNVLSHVVENIEMLTEFYFTVQPVGQAESEENIFMTDNSIEDALSSEIYEGVTYIITNDGVELSRLPLGIGINIYDALGRLVSSRTSSSNTERFSLPQGFYLILVNNQTIKAVRK